MKRVGSPETYETMRRAFRDLTAVESDGAATRARVLARAGRDLERRGRLRRLFVPLAAGLVMSATVGAAPAVVHRWRAPAPLAIEATGARETGSAAQPGGGRAIRIIPFETTDSLAGTAAPEQRPRSPEAAPLSDAEARSYARAHRAHFADDAPARALVAWDAYLAAFPHGAFAPEATYNRAICLVRLERRAEAALVLRRLAAAPPGSYRREEALRLLDWLGARGTN